MTNESDLEVQLGPLKRWIYLMQSSVEASYLIKRAVELGRPQLFTTVEAILDFWAYFRSALNSYAKCFVSAGRGRMRLEARDVFLGESWRLEKHAHLIDLRHTYVAHSDDNDIERACLAAREMKDEIVVGLEGNQTFAFDRLYELRDLIAFVQGYIASKQLECKEALSQRLNKHIHVLEGEDDKKHSLLSFGQGL